jgi:hypothetical protein
MSFFPFDFFRRVLAVALHEELKTQKQHWPLKYFPKLDQIRPETNLNKNKKAGSSSSSRYL